MSDSVSESGHDRTLDLGPGSEPDPFEVERVRAVLEERLANRTGAPASRVGRYTVLDRIGVGAMGIVYRAYDRELERPVAIKLVHVELDSHSVRERLLREARSMARLSSPHVATVYEIGEHAGRSFVAMELIRGRTLRAWQEQERPAWREVLAAYRQAALGLASAHAAGLVHRDFKPDNAMIDADGHVKVLDFGLARALDDRVVEPVVPSEDQRIDANPLTRTGALVGTPVYMAPEMLEGGTADPATDQFAFCVALHEALHGVRPFVGETANELREAMADIGPGRERAVPAWLQRIVARGLAVDPERRWPSMHALAAALERDPGRARRRWIAVAVAVVGAILVIALPMIERARATYQCEREGAEIGAVWGETQRSEATEAFVATELPYAIDSVERVLPRIDAHASAWQQARTEACLDTMVHDRWSRETLARATWCLEARRLELATLIDDLVHADAGTVSRAVTEAAALEPIEPCRDAALLDRLPVPSEEQREEVRALDEQLSGVDALERAGKPEEALALAEEVAEAAAAIEWPPLRARAESTRAATLAEEGDFEASLHSGRAAYFDAAQSGAWDVAAEAAIDLVALLGDQLARPDDAIEWSDHAALAIEHAGDFGRLRKAALLDAIGRTQLRAGHFAEAAAALEEAAALREATLGADHPSMASTLVALSIVAGARGDVNRARSLLERALATSEATLGPDHPSIATVLFNLGSACAQSGDYEGAEVAFSRSLAISEGAFGPDHPDVGQTLSNLGFLYYTMGDSARAQPMLERALRVRERSLGAEHPNLASTLNTLASVHAERGSNEQARALYERALAITQKARGSDHPEYAQTLFNLAALAWSSGDHAGSIELYERALAIFENAVGPDHPEFAQTLATLAEIDAYEGRVAASLPKFERAIAIYDLHPGAEGEAEARFNFARRSLQARGDRAAACEQARRARDHYRGAGSAFATALAEIDAWMTDARCN